MDMEDPRAQASHDTGAGGTSPVRCMVVASGGAPSIPSDLRASLERHGVKVVTCADVYGAMAGAMANHRGPTPGSEPSPTAVLIVEPELMARSNELVWSLARFAPRIAVWRYDADASPKLRGFRPARSTKDPDIPPFEGGVGPARSDSAPRLRLTGMEREGGPLHFQIANSDDVDAIGASETDGASERERPSDLLSAEELSMLLADDPPSPEPRDWRDDETEGNGR